MINNYFRLQVMKCTNCGKEFGQGKNCQNCGVDRVTGLGNYSGYDRPTGNDDYSGDKSSNYGGYSPNTTVCYACSEIVPVNSVFCPVCGRKLWVECPNCGATYSSQYKICSKCGTNRYVYYKQKEAEKQKAIREEQERQRKQREWEQSPEGKAELERRRKERDKQEERSVILGQIIFWVGGLVLTFGLDSMIDKNWLNYDIFGFDIRIIILMCISFGASFLSATVIDNIISED